MTTVSMVEIGERLKEAREKRAITVDQAQKQTHIHSNVIIALEEGKCDDILTPMYVKSFLKKYTQYLGLDSKGIIDQYTASHPESSRTEINIQKTPAVNNNMDISKFIFPVVAVILAIVFISLGIFVWNKTAVYLKRSRPAKSARTANHKQGPATVKQSKQKKSLKLIDLKLKEVARIESSSDKTVMPAISLPKNVPFDVVIRVKQPVLISIKKDGILLFKRVLPKGTIESLKVNDYVNIFIAKADAIDLALNGNTLNIPAKGVIQDLEITRKGIKIR